MKKFMFIVLLCTLLITGCSEKQEPEESWKKLEPYMEEGDAKAEDLSLIHISEPTRP